MFPTKYLITTILFVQTEAAKILAACHVPSLSHQIVFYPIINELLNRGHQVVFITTNPMYTDDNRPENLREIDLGFSYDIWKRQLTTSITGSHFAKEGSKLIVEGMPRVFGEQIKGDAIQEFMKTERHFDLLLLQGVLRPAIVWSHFYKAPVVLVNSVGTAFDNSETFGIPIQPLFYNSAFHQKIYNLTFYETLEELYYRYYVDSMVYDYEATENEIIERVFGPGVPPLSELQKRADALLLNLNSFWDRNRPLPKNVVYFGQIHQKPVKELPQDIKSFLDTSEGAIYMSFGTNVRPSTLPEKTIRMFVNVFSQLPYRVLWKFDAEIENRPQNVMIRKWFPQSDIFRHPKLKLIITQGGLQTVEEAVECGVPLLGFPFIADQWLNIQHCTQYGFGAQLDIETVDEEQFRSNILKIIEDPSYLDSIRRFKILVYDTKLSPLERAMTLIEYVLNNSGASYLKSPASNLTWREYFELELIGVVLSSVTIFLISFWYILKYLYRKSEELIAAQGRSNGRVTTVY